MRKKKELGVASDKKIREAKKKFIFGYEGEKTEKQYFEGISNYREELEINQLVEIVSLDRINKSESNQLKVVKEIDTFIQSVKCYKDENNSLKENIKKILNTYNIEIDEEKEKWLEILEKDNQKNNAINEFKEILSCEKNKVFLETLKKIKNLENIEFGYDEINIIIDRDAHSFTEYQFEEVMDICKNNNYNLGLTNPCFEFWLLLHHTNCNNLSIDEIKENKKITKDRNFIDKKLVEVLGEYKKNKIKFAKYYKDNIKTAINNNKIYYKSLENLKSEIGSSVGEIIEKILIS